MVVKWLLGKHIRKRFAVQCQSVAIGSGMESSGYSEQKADSLRVYSNPDPGPLVTAEISV